VQAVPTGGANERGYVNVMKLFGARLATVTAVNVIVAVLEPAAVNVTAVAATERDVGDVETVTPAVVATGDISVPVENVN